MSAKIKGILDILLACLPFMQREKYIVLVFLQM